MRHLSVYSEDFPIAGTFRIARSSLTRVQVVTVEIMQNGHIGRGECRPYPRYDETQASVIAQIEAIKESIQGGLSIQELQNAMPAGAARNAVDCALWDLKAKMSGNTVWQMLELPQPKPVKTAYTLSIDTPNAMAKAALEASDYKLLKIKIKDKSGLQAALNIMRARPDAELIIDANEALSPEDIPAFRQALARYPVIMIEQPITAGRVKAHPQDPSLLPILCADESLHGIADLDGLWDAGYRAVNVKLDKCGGLTEAHNLMIAAKAKGFVIMAGCMVGSSLAIAPMMQLTSYADVIDLDGAVLLAKDRDNGLRYAADTVYTPSSQLWG